MTRMPGAIWLPLSRNYTNARRSRTNALILHVAVSEAASLRGWFNNPVARASSHLYVRRDGTIEQYVDLDLISWCNGMGDARAVTVETQGMGHGEWTDAQVKALADIARFVHETYGVPLVPMHDSKTSSAGVGYHKLGVPASYAQKVAKVSQTGGELWSSSVGKTCPGPDRVRQVNTVIARAAGLPTGGGGTSVPAAPAPAPAPSTSKIVELRIDGQRGPVTVKNWQVLLAGVGHYKGLIDGNWGPMSVKAEQAWLRSLGYYTSAYLIDGVEGPATIKALQTFLRAKGHYTTAYLIDGRRGAATVMAEQRYLNSQRQYF